MSSSTMTTIAMSKGLALFVPGDWVILNAEDAPQSKHACVVNIPDAKKYGGNPTYIYFGNTPVSRMTPDFKNRIYARVDRVWPRFLQLRCMEPEIIVDSARHKAYLGEAVARVIDKKEPGVGDIFREMMTRVPDDEFMEYMKRSTGFDDEMMTAMLSHITDPTIPKHGIFEIYPEGEYPLDEKPPYGAMIICARKEARN
ncbi:hypothetical protein [Gordonibacter urolithinfaciens]|uniref:hypothetical protein n=1 Tax=Gordonibacter urolithinfaciens TaxID=1335613 RepID=UPI003A8D8C85